MSLQDTLGNQEWLKKNELKIKDALPETWTHLGNSNINGLQIGFQLKLIGIDWRSEDEFGCVMVFFEKIGLLLREGLLIKRNPNSVFGKVGAQDE
jgi:hypothetical protein